MNAPRLLRMLYHQIGSHRIDVGAVVDMNYSRRLFCILDRDKPYEFDVSLYEPHQTTRMVYNRYHHTYYPVTDTELYVSESFRLPSEDECKRHINEIQGKQRHLEELEHKLRTREYKYVPDD